MTDKELQNQIYKDAENIQIPGSIEPKAMDYKLKGIHRKRTPWIKIASLAAACIVLVAVGFSMKSSEADDGYEKLYAIIDKMSANTPDSMMNIAEDSALKAAPESAQSQSADRKSKDDYSDTNVQVEGVDEGDLVKTDGQYIYILDTDYNMIKIVKIKAEKLSPVSTIKLGDGDCTFRELYIKGQQLVALGDRLTERYFQSEETIIKTYDISDKEKPELTGTVIQSGNYNSSRREGDYLYIFSNFYASTQKGMKDRNTYVPSINKKIMDLRDICIPKDPQNSEYLVMSSIDLKHPDRISDKQAILSSAQTFYVSSSNIYAAGQKGPGGKETEIIKFTYKDGKFSEKVTGKVLGTLEDSFSMDEYRGDLRLVTTLNSHTGTTYNNVYVLDESLRELGSILKLAKDERIYSARFMGDMGYFVTYRETDPLFSVDLSDPRNPKIVGALKIPGFSEYLHFYGKSLLLGIGVETGVEASQSVKLSMFDISDPTDVKEVSKHVIKGASYAEALYNHKAVMIDIQKNLFGFATEGEGESQYRAYSYKNKRFNELAKIGTDITSAGVRGLYSGDFFYLVEPDRVRSFALDNLKEAQVLDTHSLTGL